MFFIEMRKFFGWICGYKCREKNIGGVGYMRKGLGKVWKWGDVVWVELFKD